MTPHTKNISVSSETRQEITRLRESIGLTKAELADRSGLSERTVRDLELGRRTRIQEKTLVLLAEALEVDQSRLRANGNGGQAPPVTPPNNNTAKTRRSRPSLLIAGIITATLAVALLVTGHVARTHANWSYENGVVTVRDAVFGTFLWDTADNLVVRQCMDSPWSARHIIIGTDPSHMDDGQVACVDRANGEVIWSVGPDINAAVRAFGDTVVLADHFRCNRISTADLNGDGEPELVAGFIHRTYYPYAICIIDRHGRRQSQYLNKGHVFATLTADIDDDGKDELVMAGANNAKNYLGPTIFLLDDECRTGASVDALCNPESSEPDSARFRVVMPIYPELYMHHLDMIRLSVKDLSLIRSRDGSRQIKARLWQPNVPPSIVFLDTELHPLEFIPTDEFVQTVRRALPDSITGVPDPADPAWQRRWLADIVRFEAGHWPPRSIDHTEHAAP